MTEFLIGIVLAVPVGWLVFAYGWHAVEFAKGLASGKPTDLGGWLAYLLIAFFCVGSLLAAILFLSTFFHSEDRVFGAAVALFLLWLLSRRKPDHLIKSSDVPSVPAPAPPSASMPATPPPSTSPNGALGTKEQSKPTGYTGPERYCGHCMTLVTPKRRFLSRRCSNCGAKI